ncbi:MAG: hypothetical protein SCM96_08530 [Acidobacteriota bacterium]|nr:hypothetical protein [Acidobacteriota bacterium]
MEIRLSADQESAVLRHENPAVDLPGKVHRPPGDLFVARLNAFLCHLTTDQP